MDIFSHGLWAGAAYKAVKKKKGKQLNVWLAGFWGIFPDLLSFTVGFVWILGSIALGGMSFADLPHPPEGGVEPVPQDTLPVFQLTSLLYNISHSAVIFLLVFGLIFLILKRPVWELGGWLIHILLDIPTHSYEFYPTPFLWPISSWTFDGFSWGTLWFLIPNYVAIIIVYILLRKRKRAHTSV